MWNNRPPFGQPQFFGLGSGRPPFQQQPFILQNPFGVHLPMNNFGMMQRFSNPVDQRPMLMHPRQRKRPRREPETNYAPPNAAGVNPAAKPGNTNEKDQPPKTVNTQFAKSVSAQSSGNEPKSTEKTLSQPPKNEQSSSDTKNTPGPKSDIVTNLAQQCKNIPQVEVTSQPAKSESSEASKDVKGTPLKDSPAPSSLPSTSKASTEKFGQSSNSGNDARIKFPPQCPEGSWFCRECKNINFKFRTRCFKCTGQRKENEAPMPSRGGSTPASDTMKKSLLANPWLTNSGADNSVQQKNPPVPNITPQKPVQTLLPQQSGSFECFPPRPLEKQPLLNIGSQQQQPANPRMPSSQFVGNRMPFQGSQPRPSFVPPHQNEPSFETFPPPIRPVIQPSRPVLLNAPPRASAPVPEKPPNPMSEQEVEFNKMFQNWEESFEKWKSENFNNPDRDYVNNHVKSMNELRQRLLDRREKLFRANPVSEVKERNEKIPETVSAPPPVTKLEPSQPILTQKPLETQQPSRPLNPSLPKESLQQKAQPPQGFQAERFKNQAQAPQTFQSRQPISVQDPKKQPTGFGDSFVGFQQNNASKAFIDPKLSTINVPSAKPSQKTEYLNLPKRFEQHSKFEDIDDFGRSDLKEKLKKNRVVIDYNHQGQSSANDFESSQQSWKKDSTMSSQSSDKYFIVDYDHQFDDKIARRPSAIQSFSQDSESKKRLGESSLAQSPKRGKWNEPNMDFKQQKDLNYFSNDYTSSKYGYDGKPDDVAWDSYKSHKVAGDHNTEKTQGTKPSLGHNLSEESGSIRKNFPDQRNSYSPPGRSGRMNEEWPEKFDKWHRPGRQEETDYDKDWRSEQKSWQSERSSNFEKTDYPVHNPKRISNPFSENETTTRQSFENFPGGTRFGQDDKLHQKSPFSSTNFEKNSRQETSSDNWTRSQSIERREMKGPSNPFGPYDLDDWSRKERSPNSNTWDNDDSSARNDFPWSKGNNNPPSAARSRSDISPERSNSQWDTNDRRGSSLDQKYGQRRDDESFRQEKFNPKDFHSSSYERIPPPLHNDGQYSRQSWGQSKMDQVTESKTEEEEDWFKKNYKGGQSFRRSSSPGPSFNTSSYEGNSFSRQNLNDNSTTWEDKFSYNRGQMEAGKSFGRNDFQFHPTGQFGTKGSSELSKPVFMGVPHPTKPLPDMSDKVVSFDELFKPPGRFTRPKRMVLVLRGLPGSGKTPFAKAVKQLEAKFTKEAPRILSINDYFENDGEYEYDEKQEALFMTSLVKSFRKQIDDGFFDFIIVDAVNEMTAHYEEIWSHSQLKGFEVYICEFPDKNPKTLSERSVHKRSRDDLQKIAARWQETPRHFKILNINTYLQDQEIENVDMESEDRHKEVPKRGSVGNFKNSDDEEDSKPGSSFVLSKWEIMEDNDKIDRLDGVSANARKKMSQTKTIDDWLELSERQAFSTDGKGKKRVRWADIEESAAQIRMRDVGFIVGQTNWNRMLDPNAGQSALNRTKIIPNRFQT